MNGNALANEDATVKVPAKAPKAPRKRKNAAQKDETPEGSSQKKPRGRGKKAAQIKAEDGDESGGDVQDTPTPSKRQAKGGLPKSLDEAKTEDKLLYEMKENGTAIGEVVKMWHRETGSSTTAKALHNRYYRLKVSDFLETLFCSQELDARIRLPPHTNFYSTALHSRLHPWPLPHSPYRLPILFTSPTIR